MKKKRIIYWLILVVLFTTNVFILLHRNDGYKYFPYKSTTELYVTDSSLYLKDLQFKKDSVHLLFSQNLQQQNDLETWEVYADSVAIGFAKANSNSLTIALKTGIHRYSITSIVNKQNILLTIDHSSYNNQYVNEFLYCNLSGPQIKVGTLKTWHSDKGFSPTEKQNALQLLKDKTNFNKDSSDFYNTQAISKFITTLCKNSKGLHAYKVSELRPLGQIQEALKCNADLACGNYAAMVGYLFSVAKIPNRLVTFVGPAGNWQYGIHYYNEIFLREKQQWVLVDAANNIVMPFNNNSNQFLNAVSIKSLINLNNTNNALAYTFKNDSTQIVPYDRINNQHIYYNQSNANLSFLHANANVINSPIKSFFEFYNFNRDCDYYSEVNRNDWFKIIVKEFFAILLLVTFLMYCVVEIRNKKSAK